MSVIHVICREVCIWFCYWKVLEQVSPKPDEVNRSTALQHPAKNRTTDYLPGTVYVHTTCVVNIEVKKYIFVYTYNDVCNIV